MIAPEVLERFWAKVDRRGEDECWEWRGANASGYGQFGYKGETHRATRFSIWLHTGKQVPRGLNACHKCDNPKCVNPDHLFIGSQSDNLKDAVAKRRHWNSRKTHCSRGHKLAGENLYVTPENQRECMECRRIARRKHAKKARQDAPTGGHDD